MAEQRLVDPLNLRSLLRFNGDAGRIWLDGNRMLLLHAKAMAALRRELFATLGPHRAAGVLVRTGFVTGREDADIARKLFGEGDDYDVFNVGPVLHRLEGIVQATITNADFDWEAGIFCGTVELRGSWEAEAQLAQDGVGQDCACWTIAGHATGYVSQFFRRFIVFREVACVAKGDECCRLVAKPAEAWGDDPYLTLFRDDQTDDAIAAIENDLARLRRQSPSPSRPSARPAPGALIGASPGFLSVLDKLDKAARTRVSVLLLGETGVGKEMFARWLHDNSDRADKPFLAVNCGAIPHDLIESELFGVQRGAYTSAHQSRPGRFERADGGTLLLDEIGDLSLSAQVKLLRVLQTGEVERLGDDRVRKVDVRVIAATNVDLKQAIAAGRFRSDLYYRLATYPVTIPTLRDRPTDIPLLATAFAEKFQTLYGKTLKGLSDCAIIALRSHTWPGNIRELENIIERAILLTPDGEAIQPDHLLLDTPTSEPLGHPPPPSDAEDLCARLLDQGLNLEAHEARLLRLATDRANGNLAQAARLLGLTRRQLAYRLGRQDGAAVE